VEVKPVLVLVPQLAREQARPVQVQAQLQLAAESELAKQAAALAPAAQHLALVRLRARMTRARGSIPGTPQQQTSINASSGHHLSRKNEPIDHQGYAGQSSSQQIDHSCPCHPHRSG